MRTADLRYGGQSWEIEVALPDGPVDRALLEELRARFEDEHEQLYGVRGQPGSPVEIRAVRLAALGPAPAAPSFDIEAQVAESHEDRRAARVSEVAAGELVDVAVRTRSSIGSEPEPGPMLVDEYDTTVVVPAEWSVRRHVETGTLVLEREARQ
jgi:N-methylhydantoinase A